MEQDVAAPGGPLYERAATMAGIKSWSVYLGKGVTVVGRDAQSNIQAVMGFHFDGDRHVDSAACAVSPTLGASCTDLSHAIGKDLESGTAAGPAATTASLRPLDVSVDDVAAFKQCNDALSAMANANANASWSDSTLSYCSTSGQTLPKGSCALIDPNAKDAAKNAVLATGNGYDLADTCCHNAIDLGNGSKAGMAQLVGKGVPLLCK